MKNVWVSPDKNHGTWKVHIEKGPTLGVYNTKSDAHNNGKKIAVQLGVELIEQRRDGTIGSKDSFGSDPVPPRDKEH